MAVLVVPFTVLTSSGAGSTVALPAVAGAAPGGLVSEIHISAAPGNAASIHVYDVASGATLKSLLPPAASGITDHFCLKSGQDENGINPLAFGIKFDGATDKAEGYAVVR